MKQQKRERGECLRTSQRMKMVECIIFFLIDQNKCAQNQFQKSCILLDTVSNARKIGM
jgi:hypothetical protein